MARNSTQFVCQACGAVHPRWAGRCDACGEWNSIAEEAKPDAVPIGGKAKASTTAKECLEVCERLHLLMREAEREAYELQRRIRAWESLNRNDLSGVQSLNKSIGFSPCRCWYCSCAVTSCLLTLWQNLFQADPSVVQPSEVFVELLLQSETSSISSSRSLIDNKRLVAESIATQSRIGAQLVLNGLRKRLGVGQDVYAAELLGRILESSVESPLRSEFEELAAQQLEQQQSLQSFQFSGL